MNDKKMTTRASKKVRPPVARAEKGAKKKYTSSDGLA